MPVSFAPVATLLVTRPVPSVRGEDAVLEVVVRAAAFDLPLVDAEEKDAVVVEAVDREVADDASRDALGRIREAGRARGPVACHLDAAVLASRVLEDHRPGRCPTRVMRSLVTTTAQVEPGSVGHG